MTSRIAGFPSGLLDLLGSQNFGEAPKLFGDQVVPTLECLELYLATKNAVVFNAGTGAVANGQNTGASYMLTVPQGELWLVRCVSALLLTAAGEAVTGEVWISSQGGTMVVGNPRTLGASSQGWAVSTQTPFWLPSGSRIGIWGSAVTGAPTAALTALVARLRA